MIKLHKGKGVCHPFSMANCTVSSAIHKSPSNNRNWQPYQYVPGSCLCDRQRQASSFQRLPKRHLCTSSEGESSDLDSSTLTERWSDQVATLNSISSSLKEGGLVRENHLTELNRVGRGLFHDDIPDIKWVIEDAAQARSLHNNGVDRASPQVQHVLSKIEVARDVAHFLEDDSFISNLSKDPLKRNIPGEGETRAAELHRLLEDRVIPAVSAVITAYEDLIAITATANEASTGSDSGDSVSSNADSVSSDADSGGEEW